MRREDNRKEKRKDKKEMRSRRERNEIIRTKVKEKKWEVEEIRC